MYMYVCVYLYVCMYMHAHARVLTLLRLIIRKQIVKLYALLFPSLTSLELQ